MIVAKFKHACVLKFSVDAVDRLLAAGADVNIINYNHHNHDRDYYGDEFRKDNALAIACDEGDLTIVDKLIVHGAKINVDDRDPPFIAAAIKTANGDPDEDIIDRLIELGADINIRGLHGGTALELAIEENYIFTIQLLMDKGADPETDGDLVYAYSERLINRLLFFYGRGDIGRDDFFDIMNKFVILGVDINHIYDNGKTLLMEAVETHNIERVRRLIELGADVNMSNNVGQTALLIARRNGDEPMIELLLEHGAQ